MPDSYPSVPGVQFRDIPGHFGYCVGDNGIVYSRAGRGVDAKGSWHPLGGKPDYWGYYRVTLYRSEAPQRHYVHLLVLTLFDGPCPEGQQCRHLDGCKTNNNLSNLMWGTPYENTGDQYLHGTKPEGERHGQSKCTDAQVAEMIEALKSGDPIVEIARRYGVSETYVWMVGKNRNRKSVPRNGYVYEARFPNMRRKAWRK